MSAADQERFTLTQWRAVHGAREFVVASGTEVGMRYRANFDVVATDPRWPLVVVADGMGDGPGSAAAGPTAVDVFRSSVAAGDVVDARRLRSAVAEAQRQVRAAGNQLPDLTGCTLTALVGTGGDEGWVVQLGDSRAYRLRAGLLELLTVDHTAAWLGAVYGWYAADSPAATRARYHLHRYVGHPDDPEPDVLAVTFRPGDVYCVCTDGLAEQVSYERLAEALGQPVPPVDTVAALLRDSLAAGGHDNATLAVIRVGSASVDSH